MLAKDIVLNFTFSNYLEAITNNFEPQLRLTQYNDLKEKILSDTYDSEAKRLMLWIRAELLILGLKNIEKFIT